MTSELFRSTDGTKLYAHFLVPSWEATDLTSIKGTTYLYPLNISLDNTGINAIGGEGSRGGQEGFRVGQSHVHKLELSGWEWGNTITPPTNDRVQGLGFGDYVALSGDAYTAVVIANGYEDVPGSDKGKIYIYKYNNFTLDWDLDYSLVSVSGALSCTSMAMSQDGNSVVVDASGELYMLERSGGTWAYTTVNFNGRHTDISSNGTVIASASNQALGINIYEKTGGIWSLVQNIPSPNISACAVDVDRIAVYLYDTQEIVFYKKEATWVEDIRISKMLVQGDLHVKLRMVGNTCILSQWASFANPPPHGNVTIYEYDTSWGEITVLNAPIENNDEAGYGHGIAISFDQSTIAVGSNLVDSDNGIIYFYRKTV